MDQETAAGVNYNPWRSRSTTGSVPLASEGAEWDRLLDRLGLTDAEALAAVREGEEAGRPIRSFVRWAFREHFVPEDVLLAMKLGPGAAQGES